jgi:ATP-binding protein involved in chromosome partitioning
VPVGNHDAGCTGLNAFKCVVIVIESSQVLDGSHSAATEPRRARDQCRLNRLMQFVAQRSNALVALTASSFTACGRFAAPYSRWHAAAPNFFPPPVTKRPVPNVQHVILVGSGKGGVGKSTCSGAHGKEPVLRAEGAAVQAVCSAGPCNGKDQPNKELGPNERCAAALHKTYAVACGCLRVVNLAVPAVNIAAALSGHSGLTVGLLDADVAGPSIPQMMHLNDLRPKVTSDSSQSLIPLENHGIKCMSMGFLVDAGKALAWRGPMVGKALDQLLFQVVWGKLDVLIVDLPPGTGAPPPVLHNNDLSSVHWGAYAPQCLPSTCTGRQSYPTAWFHCCYHVQCNMKAAAAGDTHISLAQRLEITGAVMVTTPQEVALADVRRSVQMFRTVKIPVLGVVENMSYHICGGCGERSAVFGSGGGERLAQAEGVPLLGRLPLEAVVMEGGEAGAPVVLSHPDSASATAYRQIAAALLAALPAKPGSSSPGSS